MKQFQHINLFRLKSGLITLCLLLLGFNSFTQLPQKKQHQVDSLKRLLKTAEHDTTVVKALIEWEKIVSGSDSNLDMILSERIDSLCLVNLDKSLPEKTQKIFTQARSFALLSLGYVHSERGDYEIAVSFFDKSLSNAEKWQDEDGIANGLNAIGNMHADQGDYDRSIDFFSECLKIREEMDDQSGVADALINIGTAHDMELQLDTALNFYSKALTIKKEIGDKAGVADCLGNMGGIYSYQGDYDKALDFFSRSLQYFEEAGYKIRIAAALYNMAIIYDHQGISSKAIDYGLRSKAVAGDINDATMIRTVSKFLSRMYKEAGRTREALEMYEFYVELKDSLSSEQNQKAVIRLEYEYEYEKQTIADSIKNVETQKVQEAVLKAERAENARKESQLKQGKQRNYFLIAGLALVALFALFMFNRFRVTKKQRDIIDEQNVRLEQSMEDKQLLLKEIHHRVKNNLQVVNGLLQIQSNNTNSEEVKDIMEQSRGRIFSIAAIHELLYDDPDEKTVLAKDYLEKLINKNVQLQTEKHTISVTTNNLSLTMDQAIPLGLILNELITNSYKHAFEQGKTGEVNVSIAQNEEGFKFTYTDNGKGIPPEHDMETSKSLGLKLIRMMTQQMDAHLSLDYSNGVNYQLKFK